MRILFRELMWLVLAVLMVSSVGLAIPSSVKAQLPPCADLVITNFTISPAEPVVGQNATINITVRNQGSCSTVVGFVVQWKSAILAPTGPSTFVPALEAGDDSDPISFQFAFPNVGNFTTVATVDTDNTVNETNENNNLAIKSVTVKPDLPDLVITNMSIDPTQPVEGLNATINVTVKNQGTKPAGPFVVQWKSALLAPTGPNTQVTGLAVGASTTVSFQYAFPNDGNFMTAATVDTGFDVQESNEDNNLEIFPVTVQKAVIDLAVTQFKVEPAPGVPVSDPPLPVQGRLSRATITVQNQGNFPAGDFVVQWKPTLLSPDLATQINGLGPGASATVTFDHTYAFAGDFQTQAKADSTNKVFETNELNNTSIIPVTVEPPRPDLIITELSINPAQPVRGLQATVTVEVKNRGNTPAGIFVVEWKPTQFAPGLAKQVDGLDVGQSTTISFDHTYTFPGQFTSVAQVDSTSRVFELDENNNTQELPVTVLVDTVDLLITDMSMTPDPPQQGVPATVSIQVKNDGNSPSGSFVLEWNPDALGLITPSPSTLSSQIDDLGAGQTTTVNFDFTYPDAGTFRTVAKVDAFNTVNETNEDNNLKILNVVVEARAPDLEITNLTMNPASPTQGAQVAVSAVVKNQGNLPAGPFVLEWNPDAFGLITPSPATLSSQVNGLAVGQSTTVQFNYVYPESGNFRTIAKADAFNSVAESNEANNLRILDVTVEPGIDLIITDFKITGKGLCDGTPCDTEVMRASKTVAEITVKNQGIYPAETFWVQWKLDKGNNGGPTAKVDGLNPNQSTTVMIEGAYFQTGDFESVAIADVFDQIIESNETNNTSTKFVTVNPRTTDLKVTFTKLRLKGMSGEPGDLEWLQAFVILQQNAHCKKTIVIDPDIGFDQEIPIDADGFHCRFWINNDADPKEYTIEESIDVKILESGLLVILSAGLEVDAADWAIKSSVSAPADIAPDFGGYGFGIHPASDRWGEGTNTMISQEGEDCDDGDCFNLTYVVDVKREPLPPSFGPVTEDTVRKSIVLPEGLRYILPADIKLPEGIEWPSSQYNQYLPLMLR